MVFLWFSYGFLIKVSEHYQAGYNLYASHGATIGPLPLRIVPTDFPTWAAWPSAGCIATSLKRNTGNLGIAVFAAPREKATSSGKKGEKTGFQEPVLVSSLIISQVVLLKSKHGYPMLLDFWLKTPWNIHSPVLRRWHRSLSSGRELWGRKKGVETMWGCR